MVKIIDWDNFVRVMLPLVGFFTTGNNERDKKPKNEICRISEILKKKKIKMSDNNLCRTALIMLFLQNIPSTNLYLAFIPIDRISLRNTLSYPIKTIQTRPRYFYQNSFEF